MVLLYSQQTVPYFEACCIAAVVFMHPGRVGHHYPVCNGSSRAHRQEDRNCHQDQLEHKHDRQDGCSRQGGNAGQGGGGGAGLANAGGGQDCCSRQGGKCKAGRGAGLAQEGGKTIKMAVSRLGGGGGGRVGAGWGAGAGSVQHHLRYISRLLTPPPITCYTRTWVFPQGDCAEPQ